MLTVLVWVASLLSTGSRASVGDGHLRILSANISTWGPQAEGFLRSPEMGRIQTVALAEHHVGANRINKLDKLWRQTGIRGTAATVEKSVNSINGTSDGTCMATRNHVAMAAWSMQKIGLVWALWV